MHFYPPLSLLVPLPYTFRRMPYAKFKADFSKP